MIPSVHPHRLKRLTVFRQSCSRPLRYSYLSLSYDMSINELSPQPVSMAGMTEAAECLRTLAHPCRLRMVELLLGSEFTVGELAEACGIASHMASEHLRILRDRGFLNAERRGRKVFLSIRERGLASIIACVRARFGDIEDELTQDPQRDDS